MGKSYDETSAFNSPDHSKHTQTHARSQTHCPRHMVQFLVRVMQLTEDT